MSVSHILSTLINLRHGFPPLFVRRVDQVHASGGTHMRRAAGDRASHERSLERLRDHPNLLR